MSAHKTGALLACAGALGATLGEGTPRQVEALRAFGRHLGIAFQAVDDVLGIWGDPAVTGKPAAGDLRQHKKTLPIVHAAYFSFILSVLILAAVVLGGSGNIAGVIVGAFVVGYLPERFRGFAENRQLVFGAALVIMMIFRPQGILPSRRRAQEMTEAEPAGGLGTIGGVAPADLAVTEMDIDG